jgi:hypothetical protein
VALVDERNYGPNEQRQHHARADHEDEALEGR